MYVMHVGELKGKVNVRGGDCASMQGLHNNTTSIASTISTTSNTVALVKSGNMLPIRKILIKRSESRRSFKSDNVR
jgi:hypothetical protein